ncbi:hypothetical protein [Ruegeria sp. HKCCA5426]|uniref:hypothetical protein n=1 Tax=Ruegeria sp. HKCCA5426 TaxID=2682985 RepID=UPI001480CEB8|nr:hypothetical protein [Ruegeria sp. HKCCA5426]
MKNIKVTSRPTEETICALNSKIENLSAQKANALEKTKASDLEAQIKSLSLERMDTERALLRPLADRLDNINGNAVMYTVSEHDVLALARETEFLLDEKGVSKKNRVGTEIEFRPGGKQASKSYARKAGASITTRVKLRRVADGWRLIEARRDQCFVNQTDFKVVQVTPAAHDDIVRTATSGISVRKDSAKT